LDAISASKYRKPAGFSETTLEFVKRTHEIGWQTHELLDDAAGFDEQTLELSDGAAELGGQTHELAGESAEFDG
jgi:hypothetical protein